MWLALVIGFEFTPSVVHTIQADPNDIDLVDYFNELREGYRRLDAYTRGILQGLKGQ
jgi:hypothetical protein